MFTVRGLSRTYVRGFISLGLILLLVIGFAAVIGARWWVNKHVPATLNQAPVETASTTTIVSVRKFTNGMGNDQLNLSVRSSLTLGLAYLLPSSYKGQTDYQSILDYGKTYAVSQYGSAEGGFPRGFVLGRSKLKTSGEWEVLFDDYPPPGSYKVVFYDSNGAVFVTMPLHIGQ